MKPSQACIDLIKRHEGLKLDAYLCPAGVWTIGYGSTHGVHPGMRVNQTMAEAMLLGDVDKTAAEVLDVLDGAPWTQGAFDAVVSLAYNVGAYNLPRKAPKLTAAVKRGDWLEAGHQLLDICHGGGKVLPGLVKRREAEYQLMTGVVPQ